MQDNQEPQSSHVSVEDLLRLKRHEKPDEAYWERFDRELHQKSWQALAKPEPLLVRGLKAFGGKFVPALPLSAAAAFVVALSLNHFPAYTASNPVHPVYTAPAPVSADVVAPSAPVAGMAADFAQGSHQATFVVGQFDAQSSRSSEGNVTLVAASRPMPVEANQNVYYVGGSFDSGFGSENVSDQSRVY